MSPRALGRVVLTAARLAAGVAVVRRLLRMVGAAPPLDPATADRSSPPQDPRVVADERIGGVTAGSFPSISVVVPARDEERRIGPLLDRVVGAPGVSEVIVVDDESADATATVAARAGARVITGAPLPAGWAGKAWALQQGVEAATGTWVVTLDADTRPDPRLPLVLVRRAEADRMSLVTVAGRFDCPTPGVRWLHPAMLTTLVYRYGAPGTAAAPGREMANGQCTAFERVGFLDAGGMTAVRDAVVEDVALARQRAGAGAAVGFVDGATLLEVRMFDTFGHAWRGWSRSLALPGVESRRRQCGDLAVILLTMVLPPLRLLSRRGDPLDAALLAIRAGTLVGTSRAYTRPSLAYWCSPLADPLAVAALAAGIARGRRQTWRGRRYS